MRLIDRKDEMARLDALSASNRKEMLVLYGRRRLGKTTLLRAYAERHPSLYFPCPIATAAESLRIFQNALAAVFQEPLLKQAAFPGWTEALAFAFERCGRAGTALVFDEIPYLLKSVPGVDSILQHLWDAQTERICLILSGSLLSVMQQEVLGRNAPLYGRRTEQMDLRPMDFEGVSGFYPGLSFVDRVRRYACWGGIPAYHERSAAYASAEQSILELMMKPDGVFYDEPDILVREELREPGVHFSILHSLATGKTRPNEIAQDAGIPHSGVNKYLDTLCRMRLVSRSVPIVEKHPQRSTKGVYRLADHFLRFWFRYVFPNRSMIEMGKGQALYASRVAPDFDTFIGPVYEEICAQAVARQGRDWLGFEPFKIGRYWDSEREVDLVVENEDASRVAFVECKWGTAVDVPRVAAGLRSKADAVRAYSRAERKVLVLSRTRIEHPDHVPLGAEPDDSRVPSDSVR